MDAIDNAINNEARYHTRCHAHGWSWADVRAQAAVKERHDQGAELDEGLFRGVQSPAS